MSHDGDKLIRQLSLVAYLMAERRPVTARDAKNAVEGYYDMSDEAFARRFYADRAELLQLGIPIRSQRDEFTGEELYTLEREEYFLPPLVLTDRELAALQTSLYLLEGQFAYAEPLRLALQNLALGRPNPQGASERGAMTLTLAGGGYSPEIAQRLAKLENAISKQKTIVFPYFAMSRRRGGDAHGRPVQPVLQPSRSGTWSGATTTATTTRVFRVSRIRGDIRFATRRERDFRIPEDFDPAAYRDRADLAARRARSARPCCTSRPSAAWLVERLWGARGRIETRARPLGALHHADYANLELLVHVDPRRERPRAAARPERAGRRGRGRPRAGARRPPRRPAGRTPRRAAWWWSRTCPRRGARRARSRPSASPCSRRCWPTCWSAAAPRRAARCRRPSCASATA